MYLIPDAPWVRNPEKYMDDYYYTHDEEDDEYYDEPFAVYEGGD